MVISRGQKVELLEHCVVEWGHFKRITLDTKYFAQQGLKKWISAFNKSYEGYKELTKYSKRGFENGILQGRLRQEGMSMFLITFSFLSTS